MSDEPRLVVRLPDGSTATVGAEAVIGRSRVADLRVDDPRVSTVHAEVSWRDGGFVVLARGGRVLADGVAVAEASLREGTRLTLAPGVVLEVVDVIAGAAPHVPRTAGRDRLTLRVGPDAVAITVGDAPAPRIVIEGLPGRVLAALLAAEGPVAWDHLAGLLWPDDALLRARKGPWKEGGWTPIDERRWRNRWDQVLASLRAQLEKVRETRTVVVRQGQVSLELEPTDRIER